MKARIVPADLRRSVSADLRRMVSAVEIVDEQRFRIDGVDFESSRSSQAPTRLSECLAKELYERLYCGPTSETLAAPDPLALRRHLAELSAANAGTGTWEPGWTGQRNGRDAEHGDLVLTRQGTDFRVPSELFRTEACSPGEYSVRVPKESQWLLPGFYLARGEAAAAPLGETGSVLRLYWHLRPATCARWIRCLTSRLNDRRIPFSLKALRDPRHYRRADAGVLYLAPAHYGRARREILRTWHEIRAGLRPDVPLLTLRLAAGLGLAEGPGDRRSFGMQRCRLIATALVSAFEQSQLTLNERLRQVVTVFQSAEVDPARPHLGPGSTRRYRRWTRIETGSPRQPPSSQPTSPAPPDFGALACRIADTLCADAFWSQGRCSWTGHEARPMGRHSRYDAVASLPADIYQGTAGVALFLAEMATRSGDENQRRTAVGAIRQALATTAAGPNHRRLSLYSGPLGVAWAAHRIATLTGEAAVGAAAKELLAELTKSPDAEGPLDLISGNAGAIVALLELHRKIGDATSRSVAVAMGRELLAAAQDRGNALVWDNEAVLGWGGDDPPLTGLAHGAAGLGIALLELFGATSEPNFLTGARRAFAYEDALFCYERGNWPDLRGTGTEPETARHFRTAWCHGAPGIILSRLRALRVDPEPSPVYEANARAGLATTMQALEQGLKSRHTDTSLCHGLCGLVEIALLASELLSEPTYRTNAEASMRQLLEVHRAPGEWPSGVRSRGPNPSLLLGQAGVGYTLLRLGVDGPPPSVLLVRATD